VEFLSSAWKIKFDKAATRTYPFGSRSGVVAHLLAVGDHDLAKMLLYQTGRGGRWAEIVL
jgi:hypothetical protein